MTSEQFLTWHAKWFVRRNHQKILVTGRTICLSSSVGPIRSTVGEHYRQWLTISVGAIWEKSLREEFSSRKAFDSLVSYQLPLPLEEPPLLFSNCQLMVSLVDTPKLSIAASWFLWCRWDFNLKHMSWSLERWFVRSRDHANISSSQDVPDMLTVASLSLFKCRQNIYN